MNTSENQSQGLGRSWYSPVPRAIATQTNLIRSPECDQEMFAKYETSWRECLLWRSVTKCRNGKLVNFSEDFPKRGHNSFTWKWCFTNSPRTSHNILATFERKVVAKNFEKCPIWSRWLLRVRPVLFTVPHVSRENNFSQETGLQGKPYLSYLWRQGVVLSLPLSLLL